MQLCKKKPNSYLEKQIRGAKDEKARIPCRARVHPCIQGVPGHRPASGAALTGCRMTQREAAGAVTAGVVVTHPAKIQVVKIWRRGEEERHCLKTSSGPHWHPCPTSHSALSPPLLTHVHLIHWHSFALVSALTANRHSHTQRRSPSRGAAAVAAIPVLSWWREREWESERECVYVCVTERERKRERVHWWVDEWVDMAKGRREKWGEVGEGGCWGKVQSCWAASAAKTP